MNSKFKILEGYYTRDQVEKVIPEGFRLMSKEEFETLIKETDHHFDYKTKEGVFTWKDGSRELRLLLNGWQEPENGKVYCRGEEGIYWAFSTPDDLYIGGLHLDIFKADMFDGDKAYSVLCIAKEEPITLKIKKGSIIQFLKEHSRGSVEKGFSVYQLLQDEMIIKKSSGLKIGDTVEFHIEDKSPDCRFAIEHVYLYDVLAYDDISDKMVLQDFKVNRI